MTGAAGVRPEIEELEARLAHPLLFVRHGETDWNRRLRLQGQRDVPLNDLGRRQAARNGRALAALIDARDWRFLASPLQRATETMRIVLAAVGRDGEAFETDGRLMEISFGRWSGLTLDEVAAQDPLGAVARSADKWNYVPPEGESYAMLCARVADWLAGLDGRSVVVAHGGVLRVLMRLLLGLPAHDAPYLSVPQDRVAAFWGGRVVFL